MDRKRAIFAWYREELSGEGGLMLNADLPGVRSGYWMVTVVWPAELGLDKKDVSTTLREAGVDNRPFFHPLSSIPAYAGSPQGKAARQRNEVSYRVASCGLNLPSALNLTRAQVAYVGEQVRNVLPVRQVKA